MAARGTVLGAAVLLLAFTLPGCTGTDEPAASGGASGGGSPPSGGGTTTGVAAPAWDAKAAGRAVDELVEDAGSSWSALSTVLVSQDGKLVLARHYGPKDDTPRDVSTITATVVGTLAGIAVRHGDLDLSDRLSRMVPDHRADMTPVVGAVTLHQLLTMQSGLPADLRRATEPWFVDTPSWAGSIVSRGLDGTPTQFAFTTASAQLVAEAVHQATGERLRDYAERTLFRPMGITRPITWPVGFPTGEDVSFGGLELTPRELVRLGQLYLDDGTVDGRRILGVDWVREATKDQQFALDPGDYGYGYLWWVRDFDGHDTYSALGEGGEMLEVVPDLGLVVAAVGDLDPTFGLDGAALQDALNDAILPDAS